MSYEVNEPILNSPFDEPSRYWFIREEYHPELKDGRRPAIVYPPRDGNTDWDLGQVLKPSPADEFSPAYEMTLVNRIRKEVKDWRSQHYPGVTRTTRELLEYWRREGREHRLFFAQLEAVETIIFLIESRADFRQGLHIPQDPPVDATLKAFTRYACKMATGSGKTTVMGMLAAWSILNKIVDRRNPKFSDVVLIVCPNVTIKGRLQELNPDNGEASLYRTRDLVPSHLNAIVADTHQWEQAAAYIIDNHPATEAFVKNERLGFSIPYFHNGAEHDYIPDFIIRLNTGKSNYLILETKGWDELREVKQAAAMRWCNAINADGKHGHWQYYLSGLSKVKEGIDQAI